MESDQRTNALLENVTWVRSLARQLVGDPDVAEDVAQDALALALDHPPRNTTAGGMRAWLRTVTRNLAIQTGRRESDRRSVEAAATREPALDSAERLELQQTVARVVLELDEIHRDVLVLRFFDDLPPREIARRLDIPGTVARKRLSRALEQVEKRLRAELSREDLDWRATLSALAGTPLHPAPVSTVPWIALGALTLVATAFVARGLLGEVASRVRVVSEAGNPVPDTRVFQLDGDDARELTRDPSGIHVGVDPDGGRLVVLPPNRPPEVFPAPSQSGDQALVLSEREWFTGSIYYDGEPPEESYDLRLLVDLPLPGLTSEVLAAGVIELEDNAVVLRGRTGDRGFFGFGGLEPGRPVRLLVPEDVQLVFRNDGELLEAGRGLRITPGRELVWLGVVDRDAATGK